MSLLVAALGAGGLVLILFALPPLNRPRLRTRVEPYLSGLRGRPSTLFRPRPTSLVHVWMSKQVARLGWASDRALEQRLHAAGYEGDVGSFRLEQLGWALLAALVVSAASTLAHVSGMRLELRVLPLLIAVALAGGVLGRDWWLTRQTTRRRDLLQQQLPTAIDLVALAVMAGEPVQSAFERVGRTLPAAIGDEFAAVVAEARAGLPIVDALERLKQRVPLPTVARFVDALCAGIERGTPLTEVLRAQAEDGREARRRYLLELGGRREVLMLVPVVFLIMPVVVVFTLYPGLVSLELLVP